MFLFKKIYTFFLELVESAVIAGAIFVAIYYFLFRPFQVSGNSMFPTYKDGEYTLTTVKLLLNTSSLKRGDVIVFESPTNQERDFIKRIIGLPGDQISIINGFIYVNNKKLDESAYLAPNVTSGIIRFTTDQTITVPLNNFFVLGDNRPGSSDSREWGFVSKDKIIGKTVLVYWPLTKVRIVKKINYN